MDKQDPPDNHQHPSKDRHVSGEIRVSGALDVSNTSESVETLYSKIIAENWYNNATKDFEQSSLRVNKFLAFFTAAYLLFTILIFAETKKAVSAAQVSADATQKALIVSNRSWIECTLDQSWADLSVDQFREKMEKVSIPVQCTNIGNMPAKNVNIRAGLEILDADRSPVFPFFPWMRITSEFVPLLYPHRVEKFSAAKPISQSDPVSDAEPMPPTLKKEFELGSKYAAVIADGTFTDQFGEHWFKYCKAVYLSTILRGYPTRVCAEYNDTGDGPLPK